MDILIIGTGRTGRAIAEHLIDLHHLEHLYLYSRTLKSAESLARDLDSPKAIAIPNTRDKHYDYIVIALGGMSDDARNESIRVRDNTYDLRQDELKYNIGAIAGLIPELKHHSDAKIIVVTNPVDELTNFLIHVLGRKEIYGFGLQLDTQRYVNALGQSVECIGTHGKAIPILGKENRDDYLKLRKDVDDRLFEYVRTSGIPHKAAGHAFKDFLFEISSEHERLVNVCAWIENEFYGIENLAVSLPFIFLKRKAQHPKVQHLSHVEKELLQEQVADLRESINRTIGIYRDLEDYK